VCCSVLQCVAVRCSELQCVALCCSVPEIFHPFHDAPSSYDVAVCCRCCGVLRCFAVCCSVLRCVVVCCGVLRCVAVCRGVLRCVAVCCSALQCPRDIPSISCMCSIPNNSYVILQCVAVSCKIECILYQNIIIYDCYEVATISRLLKITGLFCRI